MLHNIHALAEKAATSTESEARARVIAFADYERRAISSCLPEGKTVEDALRAATIHRRNLWSAPHWMTRPEDDRIQELLRICTKLMQGSELAGRLLASCAIWS